MARNCFFTAVTTISASLLNSSVVMYGLHETLCLALCLYTPLTIDFPSKCIIVDSSDGHTIEPKKQNNEDILSAREKQILGFIDKGLTSKDIAELLCISINTVSRHRQGILGKLQVKNSIEACRIAKDLKII